LRNCPLPVLEIIKGMSELVFPFRAVGIFMPALYRVVTQLGKTLSHRSTNLIEFCLASPEAV
jgi:hypothetical protein